MTCGANQLVKVRGDLETRQLSNMENCRHLGDPLPIHKKTKTRVTTDTRVQAVAVTAVADIRNKGKDEVEEDEVVAVVDMVEMLRAEPFSVGVLGPNPVPRNTGLC